MKSAACWMKKRRGKVAKQNNHTEVASFKHQDKRVNIPPRELAGFMAEDELAPKTCLYLRDPSLDPQLVWKGKDEQDTADLSVPSVPVYIQEKIQPQAIIENVRQQAAKSKNAGEAEAQQLDMFGDFNHITFEDLVEFYEHEQSWSNRMILGDSLLVMNSLAQREALKGQVQMIYMDPPYGIKFGSNWQSRLRKRDVKDGAEADLTREPEQVKAFRDTWELGIHSYLSYLRDRFVVARELLTESGSIFVQISDVNVHLVRSVLDEVFGRENFISLVTTKKSGGMGQAFIDNVSDYVIWYAKEISATKYNQLYSEKVLAEGAGARYSQVLLSNFEKRPIKRDEKLHPELLPEGSKVFLGGPLTSETPSTSTVFEFTLENLKHYPRKGGWKTNMLGMNRLIKSDRLINTKSFVNYKIFFEDFKAVALSNLWDDTMGTAEQNKIYVVQTTTKVIERCMLMTTDPGDLVLDPTCGSGTTAYVAEQWGRRWITIDTSRVSLALARMRLMSASYPYYLLADSPEGYLKELELSATPAETLSAPRKANFSYDLRQGFIYERVPHITLKSIANNPEIDQIYERWQKSLEPLRAQINQSLGTAYEEWQMPQTLSAGPKADAASTLLQQYWQARRGRQAEIDASIARRADLELLYDKPYEDRSSAWKAAASLSR
jgi:adenine-specific DNA-methyltransferase